MLSHISKDYFSCIAWFVPLAPALLLVRVLRTHKRTHGQDEKKNKKKEKKKKRSVIKHSDAGIRRRH